MPAFGPAQVPPGLQGRTAGPSMVQPDEPEPSGPHAGLAEPEQLHPALWRAHQVGHQRDTVVASGFAALDAELPGHGWPSRALTELLLPHPGIGEIRLLAPALSAVQQAGRGVMLIDPPSALCGWTLAALGLDLRQLVLVQARPGGLPLPLPLPQAQPQRAAYPASASPPASSPAPARLPASDVLWALEQALKSGHAGAVLAWLPPRVRPDALRRLQLAAQAHDGPAFLLREQAAQARPSAAPLRLVLAPVAPDELSLHIVKRRGPPLQQALQLALAPVLSAPARARALRAAAAPRVPVRAGTSMADAGQGRVSAAADHGF
jgi:protein ImuA